MRKKAVKTLNYLPGYLKAGRLSFSLKTFTKVSVLSNLRLVGISFQSLPVALREEFALTNDKKENAPILLKEIFGLSEIVCLFTCNRIEYYYTSEIEIDPLQLFSYFCQSEDNIGHKIRNNIYYYTGDKVISHLFKVVSGLKSMLIGESQILNQIKKAFQISSRSGCVHKELNGLFQFAFKTAKDIHRFTNLDAIKRSIASLSIEMAESILGSMNNAKVLILGTGDTAELTRKALLAKGIEGFLFMSKTEKRAKEWSLLKKKPTLLLWQLPIVINDFDVVIACTDCQEPLIKKEMFFNNTKLHNKPKVLIDLGVPRNIESSIGELQNVYLRNIDDMKSIFDSNHDARMKEVVYAGEIIEEAVDKYKCRQSLNRLFYDIHESCMDDASDKLRKAVNNFQISGDLESFEEEISSIIIKSIEAPLDGFRSLANKIPSSVLNSYAFSNNLDFQKSTS